MSSECTYCESADATTTCHGCAKELCDDCIDKFLTPAVYQKIRTRRSNLKDRMRRRRAGEDVPEPEPESEEDEEEPMNLEECQPFCESCCWDQKPEACDMVLFLLPHTPYTTYGQVQRACEASQINAELDAE